MQKQPHKPRKMPILTLKIRTGDIPDAVYETDDDLVQVYGHYTLTRDPNNKTHFILTAETAEYPIEELLMQINKRVRQNRALVVVKE